jgi:hypothetical protein
LRNPENPEPAGRRTALSGWSQQHLRGFERIAGDFYRRWIEFTSDDIL